MAQQIDALHMEISAFLRNLDLCNQLTDLKITDKTVELLQKAVASIDELFAKSEIISHHDYCNYFSSQSSNGDSDFVFGLDGNQYELRRHIMCRLCLEQVSMEKEDLMAHQQKTSHQQRLNRMEQEKNMFVQSVGLADAPENVQSSNMLAENDQADDLLVFAEPLANKAESYGGYSDDNDELVFDANANKAIKEAFAKSQYAPSSYNFDDTLYVIKASCIPWTSKRAEVQAFFADVNILNGVNGIHFIVNVKKNSVNEAYIQLEGRLDYSVIQSYNNKYMDGVKIKGGVIKILTADIFDFMQMVTKPGYPEIRNVIRLKNVPADVNEQTVRNFFKDSSITGIRFLRMISGSIEAFVQFATMNDTELSLNIMGKTMNGVFVKIYRSSEEQALYCCTKLGRTQNHSQSSLHSNDTQPQSYGSVVSGGAISRKNGSGVKTQTQTPTQPPLKSYLSTPDIKLCGVTSKKFPKNTPKGSK